MKENLIYLRISFWKRVPNLILVFAGTFNPKIMQKKTFLAAITALALAVIIIPSAFAFSGPGGPGRNIDPEIHAAIQEAFENEDYEAFQGAVADLPDRAGIKNLTEEEFNEIVEKRAEMEADREAIQDAIESGDYEEWKSLMEEKNPNNPLLEIITKDNFSKFQELHELREEMKTIQGELGIGGDFGGESFGGGRRGGLRGFRN